MATRLYDDAAPVQHGMRLAPSSASAPASPSPTRVSSPPGAAPAGAAKAAAPRYALEPTPSAPAPLLLIRPPPPAAPESCVRASSPAPCAAPASVRVTPGSPSPVQPLFLQSQIREGPDCPAWHPCSLQTNVIVLRAPPCPLMLDQGFSGTVHLQANPHMKVCRIRSG